MPHALERASSARSKCRGCGERIDKAAWRFGESLPNPFDDKGGEMTHWFHVTCAAYRRPEPFLETLKAHPDVAAELADREDLEREAALGVADHRLLRVSTAERAASGRATCRACKAPIDKGAWRIALVFYEDGRFSPAGFIHVTCVPAYIETRAILPRVRHFSPTLTDDDVAELARELTS
jgi:ribosomal protein L37AE/L43A